MTKTLLTSLSAFALSSALTLADLRAVRDAALAEAESLLRRAVAERNGSRF